jgi:hypothetical protein
VSNCTRIVPAVKLLVGNRTPDVRKKDKTAGGMPAVRVSSLEPGGFERNALKRG